MVLDGDCGRVAVFNPKSKIENPKSVVARIMGPPGVASSLACRMHFFPDFGLGLPVLAGV
jgi:hypothetical protein